MKIAGFLLLIAGWLLVLSALVLLPRGGAGSGFILAGMAVEFIGLGLVFRSNLAPGEVRDR